MYRPLLRSHPPNSVLLRSLPLRAPHLAATRSLRHVTTAPPAQRTRSWKNRAVRLALAAGAVYFYNTSSLFAEEPSSLMHDAPVSNLEDEPIPLLASLKPISPDRAPIYTSLASSTSSSSTAPPSDTNNLSPNPSDEAKTLSADASASSSASSFSTDSPAADTINDTSAAAVDAEASQQGAFNEETGEINWDCPCLGGMAYGPCGPEFRAAFGCFVHSQAEPKGMDCIDKFQGMQTCFRAHPEEYSAELDDDAEAEAEAEDGETATAATTASTTVETDAANDETTEKLRIGWERAPGENVKSTGSIPAQRVSREAFEDAEAKKAAVPATTPPLSAASGSTAQDPLADKEKAASPSARSSTTTASPSSTPVDQTQNDQALGAGNQQQSYVASNARGTNMR